MNILYTKAKYSSRYGWHLKKDMEPDNCTTCKTCGHECHCSNGGSCCGGQCECKCCEHQDNLED